VPGFLCITGADPETKYRANILELSEEPEKCWVHFLDYGDAAEVTFASIFIMPESLKEIPPLALECTLQGVTEEVTDDQQDAFKEHFEQHSCVLDIQSIKDNKLVVVVYDEENKICCLQEELENVSVVAPVPELCLSSKEMDVVIQSFTSPTTALISIPNVSEPDLDSFYESSEDSTEVIL